MICVTRLNGVFLIGLKSYPRRCGENQHRVRLWRRKYGSSPQVRGTSRGAALVLPKRGLIPAGAGKTCRICDQAKRSAAHPRRCGENFIPVSQSVLPAGSSPQVRGKLLCMWCLGGWGRLIPAGAGKTPASFPPSMMSTAHPRRCGENYNAVAALAAAAGSSPQVRGKRTYNVRIQDKGRLIPAGAGKTTAARKKGCSNTAHPRRCGENAVYTLAAGIGGGSSPQVRGKQERQKRSLEAARLIPAGAGKTCFLVFVGIVAPAHPRRCGEN